MIIERVESVASGIERTGEGPVLNDIVGEKDNPFGRSTSFRLVPQAVEESDRRQKGATILNTVGGDKPGAFETYTIGKETRRT